MGLRAWPWLLGRREEPTSAAADTAGQLVYAIGDIHGCYDLMKDILTQIAADYPARAAGRRPILIFCGDYIDRGPHSAKVLEALVWLRKQPHFDLHLLMGNHEQALLAFLDHPQSGQAWMAYGGVQSLRSYGVAPPRGDAAPEVFAHARDELLRRMPAAHLKLLEGLELLLTVGDYAFAHAGIRPGVPLDHQTENDLVAIRREFLDDPGPFEKLIVHGHSWSGDQPAILEHRIGLDTGAYATGVLSAARFDGDEVCILQARAPSRARSRNALDHINVA